MRVWITKNKTPAGGWRYEVPETGVVVTGSNWGHLLDSIEQHLRANNYPISPYLEQHVNEYMCDQFDGDGCEEVKESQLRARKISVGDVIRFTMLLGSDMLNGRERVDKDTANERAATCVACPDNIEPDGCTTCNRGRIEKMVEKLTGAIATKHDANLKSCRHCGCVNRAQVWFPIDLLHRHTHSDVDNVLPAHCWKKKKKD